MQLSIFYINIVLIMNKRFTNLFLLLLISALLLPVACCEKETPTPPPPIPEEDLSQLTLSGEQLTADNTSVWMLFKGGATTKSVEYVFVPFLETMQEGFVFDMDSYDSAKVVPISDLIMQLKCSNLGSYMLYARPVSEHGRRGESIAIPVICGYGGIEILSYNCVYLEYRVRIFNPSKCDKVSVVWMEPESDPGSAMEDMVKRYLFRGTPQSDGETGKMLLYKLTTDTKYIVGVAMLDKNQEYQSSYIFELETPEYDSLELPGPLSVSIDTVKTDGFTFTMEWGDHTEIVAMATVSRSESDEEYSVSDLEEKVWFYLTNPWADGLVAYSPFMAEGTYTEDVRFEKGWNRYFIFVPMNANGFVGRGQFVYYVLTLPNQ